MDELPEPTPEAVRKARFFAGSVFVLSDLALTVVYSVVVGIAVRLEKQGILPTYGGAFSNPFKGVTPVHAIFLLAAIITIGICRRSKISLEMRSCERIYVHRTAIAHHEEETPVAIEPGKWLAVVSTVFGALFAAIYALMHFYAPHILTSYVEVVGIVSALVALWAGCAWRWGHWTQATVDANGVRFNRSNPWLFQKPNYTEVSWDQIRSAEIVRTRNLLGDEGGGWVDVLNEATGKRQRIARTALISPEWISFRGRMRTEARLEDPIHRAVARTDAVVGTPAIAEPEQLVLQQR